MGHESADDSLDTFPVNPDEDMQGKGDLLPSLHSQRQCNVNGENYACAILFCKYFTAFSTCGKVVSTLQIENNFQLEWAASNGNRYPPYPQVMATAISQ